MKKSHYFLRWIIILTVIFTISCNNEDDNSPELKSLKGIFFLNEGIDHSSISYFSPDSNQVTHNLYELKNGVPLGKFAQAFHITNEKGFIVVTTASGNGYVEIVDMNNFEHIKTLGTFSYPREFIAVSDTVGYLSNGNGMDSNYKKTNNEIFVIDLTVYEVTDTLHVGAGPEKMVVSGNNLFIANSGGWSSDDNTISVVDMDQNEVIKTITVAYCPTDLAVDAKGNVWAYCKGIPDYSNNPVSYSNSGIVKINTYDYTTKSFELSGIESSGIKLICAGKDKRNMYYVSDAVYAIDTETEDITKLIDKVSYGIDVDPENGDIFLPWFTSATSNGNIFVYTETGTEKLTLDAGIMPNSAVFNY